MSTPIKINLKPKKIQIKQKTDIEEEIFESEQIYTSIEADKNFDTNYIGVDKINFESIKDQFLETIDF